MFLLVWHWVWSLCVRFLREMNTDFFLPLLPSAVHWLFLFFPIRSVRRDRGRSRECSLPIYLLFKEGHGFPEVTWIALSSNMSHGHPYLLAKDKGTSLFVYTNQDLSPGIENTVSWTKSGLLLARTWGVRNDLVGHQQGLHGFVLSILSQSSLPPETCLWLVSTLLTSPEGPCACLYLWLLDHSNLYHFSGSDKMRLLIW